MATERHFQRASNHNALPSLVLRVALKDIFKEHQITTVVIAEVAISKLKDIFKEHQITT